MAGNKLQERLLGKTANIDRKNESLQRPEGPTTMPGQLGAFRNEAKRYQTTITELEGKLNEAQARVEQAEQDARQQKLTIAELEAQVKAALAEGTQSIVELALDMVDDSPYQPRFKYDASKLDQLAQSLADARQKEPVIVRRKGARYELISGHRRKRAARNLGWEQIKAVVVDMDDDAAEQATIVANESREDLHDFERAHAFRRAREARWCGPTQEEIARFYGHAQGTVSKCLAMLDMPDAYQVMFSERPDLFSANGAAEIRKLLDEHPKEADLVLEAARRVYRGDAHEKGIKAWVEQMIKQRAGLLEKGSWVVATNRAGKPVFSSKAAGKAITVRIEQKVDSEKVHRAIAELLRTMAQEE